MAWTLPWVIVEYRTSRYAYEVSIHSQYHTESQADESCDKLTQSELEYQAEAEARDENPVSQSDYEVMPLRHGLSVRKFQNL